jgi:hypothetical protein
LLGDGRIQIRIHTSYWWIRIRIQEAQKHVDPVDPDSDPDTQHCFEGLSENGRQADFSKNLPRLSL